MKKLFLILFLFGIYGSCHAQEIEQGDSEILFNATYTAQLGEYGSQMAYGSLLYSYYFTNRLNIGIGPIFTYWGGNSGVNIAGLLTVKYNFSSASKTIPYINAEFYQFDFSPEGQLSFIDYTFANIGIGLKNFFNDYVALDTNIKYGFPLGDINTNGMIQVLSGISVLF